MFDRLIDNDPKTYGEAMSNINSRIWIKATKSEMDSMSSNNVWTLVDPPKGVKPGGYKWVYKRKLGADGEVTTFKARLVAKGWTCKWLPLTSLLKKRYIWISRRVSHLLEKSRRFAIQMSIMVSNKLPGTGISVLMRSYEVMISSRVNLTLVYTR
ncbi:UNVERIFIED_CONTAM: hypothetical protein Sangu_2521800, partial [Sesamum angustifolium]